MATPVLMPQQGNTVEECLITAWKKKPGETVNKGEVLADIETDKAAFELEAPESGTLLVTFFDGGQLVPVQTVIAVIGKPGEAVDSFKPSKTAPAAKADVPTQTTAKSTLKSTVEVTTTSNEPAGRLSPRARDILKRRGISLKGVLGSGNNGRTMAGDLKSAVKLSPVASELSTQGFRNPDSGSGPAGLVMAGDMLQPGKPLSGVRAIIAQRMAESLLTTAQYTVSVNAPASQMLALRKKIKARMEKGGFEDITIGDMVNFACIKTLIAMPELNAELVENILYVHKEINLAFACDTPRGLLVPVIKKAGTMTLSDLSKATKTLATSAQEGKIGPDNLAGGTFTVSNLGGFGVTSFTPVINAPQVAILGVCTITPVPVRKGASVEFEDRIGLSLTSDHQAIDGAVGARFLSALSVNLANIEALSGLSL